LLIDGNPSELVEIKQLVPNDYTKERKRLLSTDEIIRLQTIFNTTTQTYADAAQKTGIERPLKMEWQIALWLCLGTLCRIGELLMSEWKHVNLEWTPHDLRRTGATMMQKLKISREVINLCQNHVIGSKVDRVYLLDDYADEKREAWNKLGNKLEEILNTSNADGWKSA
jgi:integrase